MKGLNTAELDKRLLKLSTALLVQKEVRKCTSLKQIYTYLCTETVALHGQDQSLLFGINNRSVSFLGAGNVQPADPDAPLIRSIRKIVRQYLHNDGAATSASTVHVFIPDSEVSGQHEMNGLASNWLWIPLLDSDTRLIGALLLLRNSPWTDREMLLAETMGEAYGYSLSTLQNRPSLRLRIKPIGTVVFILILCLLYLVKIPLLTFGDAQIVASHPVPVTSPLQGVVKKVHVPAFRMVHAGDLLVSFDKTELQATRDVAEKNLQVTQAELERIKLQSYQDPKMKSQLVIWQKKTELHNRQLTFAEKKLEECEITASMDGVIFYDDRHSWEGRPVTTGERIMQLLDPEDTMLRIDVPVKGMTPLAPAMAVRFFPDSDPASSVSGRLITIGMEPYLTAGNTLVYSHRAEIDPSQNLPELGSRGTARISGEQVRLGYYLFRRPFSRIRQFLGM